MNNTNPSIVEIKTLEKELHLLMAYYNELHLQKPTPETVQLLNATNSKLLNLLSTIKNKTNILYPKGITNQNIVRMNNKNLIELSHKLETEQSELNRSMREHNSLDGENNNLTLQLTSTHYQYTFYIIIVIVLAVYIFKIYTIDSGYEIVDMIILILAIVLLLYHFMSSFITNGTEKIQSISRKFMGALNLI